MANDIQWDDTPQIVWDGNQKKSVRINAKKILGDAIRSNPFVAYVTQPSKYTEAFLEGVGPEMRKEMGVPEKVDVPGPYNVPFEALGPLGSGANKVNPTVMAEVLRSPVKLSMDPVYRDTFVKGVASDVAGMATAPVNYMIPTALKTIGKIPIGKTNLSTLSQIDPSKWDAAIAGKKVHIRPPFFKGAERLEVVQRLRDTPVEQRLTPEQLAQAKAKYGPKPQPKNYTPEELAELEELSKYGYGVKDPELNPFAYNNERLKNPIRIEGGQPEHVPFDQPYNKPTGKMSAEGYAPPENPTIDPLSNPGGVPVKAGARPGTEIIPEPAQVKHDPYSAYKRLMGEEGFVRIKKSYEGMSKDELLAEYKKLKGQRGGEKPKPFVSNAKEKRIRDRYLAEQLAKRELEGRTDDELTADVINNLGKMTDKVEISMSDIDRNIQRVAGDDKLSATIKQLISDPRKKAVTEWINDVRAHILDLHSSVIKGLGIRRNSEISKDVFRYAEKRVTLPELQKKYPDKWQNIVEAEKYFRSRYDEIINRANMVRQQFGREPIPYRQDYMTHLREDGGIFERIFGTQDSSMFLDNVNFVQQKGNVWNPFSKARGKRAFSEDPFKAYERYVNAALGEIHLTEPAMKVVKFKKVLESRMGGTHLTKFMKALSNYSKQIEGYPHELDTVIKNLGGEKTLNAINFLNNQLGKSKILGNVSVMAIQLGNLPRFVAEVGPARALKAGVTALADWMGPDIAMKQSALLQRRYHGTKLSDLAPMLRELPEKFMSDMLHIMDNFQSRIVWHGLRDKGLKLFNGNIKSANNYAEELGSRIIVDRSRGAVPSAFTSRTLNIPLKFQIEVNNFMKEAIDLGVREPDKLIKMFVYTWGMNELYQRGFGRRPLPDPINAAMDSVNIAQSDKTIPEKVTRIAGRFGGEYLSNIAGGQIYASLFPEYGLQFGDYKTGTREQVFGGSEAGKYEPIAVKGAVKKPLTSFIPGGSQIEKTYGGVKAVKEGGFEIGKKKIKVKTTGDKVKAVVAGKYATSEAQKYFKKRAGV